MAYLLVRYRRRIYDFTGPWGLVERYLGQGSTGAAIVLVAILLFFMAITLMTGNMSRILGGTVGRVF